MKKIACLLILMYLYYGSILLGQTINHWETAVFNNDIWRYFVGSSEPDVNWRLLSYNDATWAQGPGCKQ